MITRIARVHNFYQQAGGEDMVFAAECALLRGRGIEVSEYKVHNDAISKMGALSVAAATVWNRAQAKEFGAFLDREKPQLVHFDNTFPLISPAAYHVAKKRALAVVQTLHNYRLLCPAATFMRNGGVCQECQGKLIALPAIKHACYRDNRKATAAVVMMLTTHRILGTYKRKVDRYIALSEFARKQFVDGGLPESRIVVKPNFLEIDPGCGSGKGGYALFVGRLTEEKGVRVLMSAWSQLAGKIPLKIVGDGPLQGDLREAISRLQGVEYLGRQSLEKVLDLLGDATMLVFPSIWFEGMPRTMVEAYAKGTPVLSSNLGTMAEMVQPGQNGGLFEAGNADALAAEAMKMHAALSADSSMRQRARQTYLQLYGPDQNFKILMEIYDQALRQSAG